MLQKYLSLLKKNSSSGFTLIELLIVIAIIGILVVMVVSAIDPAAILQRSEDTKDRAELNQVKTSLQLYFNDNNEYPSDLTDSATPVAFDETYMKQIPTGITYATSGSDYDAWITVNKDGDDESESHAACTAVSDLTAGGDDTKYYICPD